MKLEFTERDHYMPFMTDFADLQPQASHGYNNILSL